MSSKNVTYNPDGPTPYGNQPADGSLYAQQQEVVGAAAGSVPMPVMNYHEQLPVGASASYQQSNTYSSKSASYGASISGGQQYATETTTAKGGPATLQYSSSQVTNSSHLQPVQQQQHSISQFSGAGMTGGIVGGAQQYQGQWTSGNVVPSGQVASTIVGSPNYTMSGGASAKYQTSGMTTTQQQQSTTTHSMSGGMSTGRYKSETRVVGKEYGEQRVISVTQRVDESRTQIVGERYIEHEVRVPKKIVREEIIEKVIVVPEKIIQEEIIDDYAKVQEKIIEVARPIIVEKIVEVPEYEYVERIIEVPEKVYQDRPVHVEKIEYRDRIHQVVKIVPQERIVEVPVVQYREVPFERVVEVAEWRDEVVVKHVPVPQYVEKSIPNVVQVEHAIDVDRTIPIPVEADITYEFRIPKIKPRYHKITYPVYLPRFIEVPVALELLQGNLLQQTEIYLQQVGSLTKAAASLCEIENLATTIMRADIQSKISTTDLQSVIMKSWKEGTLNVGGLAGGMITTAGSGQYTTTSGQYTSTTSNQYTSTGGQLIGGPSAISGGYTSTSYGQTRPTAGFATSVGYPPVGTSSYTATSTRATRVE